MKVVLFNEVSLDGKYTYPQLNQEQYYSVASGIKCRAVLIGSQTARLAFPKPSREKAEDFDKPQDKAKIKCPYLVIPDSRGVLRGLLHEYRRMPYINDVIILASQTTPREYIEYLDNREYAHIIAGNTRVDLKKAFAVLEKRYKINMIRSDSGGILQSVLLRKKLADEIYLITAPYIIGKRAGIWDGVKEINELRLKCVREIGKGYVLQHYMVK